MMISDATTIEEIDKAYQARLDAYKTAIDCLTNEARRIDPTEISEAPEVAVLWAQITGLQEAADRELEIRNQAIADLAPVWDGVC